MSHLQIKIDVEETLYEAPTEWRLLGGKGKARHIIDLCERNNIKPENLLEVGAGDGSILKSLSDLNFCSRMHAVEISDSGVDVILSQNIPNLISCQKFDGYNLPFSDKQFDLAVLSHVLEHVEFERALLRELVRVSKFQVIEIPMDFTALNDPIYHLLGPSYGHINARSPESLQFLLHTERMMVLDELFGPYDYEVNHYNYFVNNSREKTPKSEVEFRRKHEEELARFEKMDRSSQILASSYYAALCRSESQDELIARAIAAIKACIDRKQIQNSRLIFNHYIPSCDRDKFALDVAEYALRKWPQASLDFLDRISSSSDHFIQAKTNRDLALEMIARSKSVAPVAHEEQSALAVHRSWDRILGKTKRSLSFLKPAIRFIRNR